jgi:hypothetical protein
MRGTMILKRRLGRPTMTTTGKQHLRSFLSLPLGLPVVILCFPLLFIRLEVRSGIFLGDIGVSL